MTDMGLDRLARVRRPRASERGVRRVQAGLDPRAVERARALLALAAQRIPRPPLERRVEAGAGRRRPSAGRDAGVPT